MSGVPVNAAYRILRVMQGRLGGEMSTSSQSCFLARGSVHWSRKQQRRRKFWLPQRPGVRLCHHVLAPCATSCGGRGGGGGGAGAGAGADAGGGGSSGGGGGCSTEVAIVLQGKQMANGTVAAAEDVFSCCIVPEI